MYIRVKNFLSSVKYEKSVCACSTSRLYWTHKNNEEKFPVALSTRFNQ